MILLIFFIYFLLILGFQTTLLDIFAIGGITPDLALILTVYCAIILKDEAGIGAGVAIGFLQDLFSGGILGVNTLSKGLIGFAFSTLKKKIMVEGFLPICLFLFIASLFDGLVFYLVSVMLFKAQLSVAFLFSRLPAYALYNALIGPLVFLFLDRNRKWLVRRFPNLENSSL